MNAETAKLLLEINFQFYQTLAQPFSQTRMRLQPGVERVLQSISPDLSIFDLGCGNGELWRRLQLRGHQGKYLGLDFSLELLKTAANAGNTKLIRQPISGEVLLNAMKMHQACFLEIDLSSADWEARLGDLQFDRVFAFASLHHLPGKNVRSELISATNRRLLNGGRFILSVWQFLNEPRLVKRLQPWENIGLTEDSVDPGDYLLDWRQGGYGIRYVHHFQEDELRQMAEDHGFKVRETYYSDGKNRRLSLYQVWEK